MFIQTISKAFGISRKTLYVARTTTSVVNTCKDIAMRSLSVSTTARFLRVSPSVIYSLIAWGQKNLQTACYIMKQKRIRHRNIPKSILEAEHSLEDFIQINPFVDIRTIRERIRL